MFPEPTSLMPSSVRWCFTSWARDPAQFQCLNCRTGQMASFNMCTLGFSGICFLACLFFQKKMCFWTTERAWTLTSCLRVCFPPSRLKHVSNVTWSKSSNSCSIKGEAHGGSHLSKSVERELCTAPHISIHLSTLPADKCQVVMYRGLFWEKFETPGSKHKRFRLTGKQVLRAISDKLNILTTLNCVRFDQRLWSWRLGWQLRRRLREMAGCGVTTPRAPRVLLLVLLSGELWSERPAEANRVSGSGHYSLGRFGWTELRVLHSGCWDLCEWS